MSDRIFYPEVINSYALPETMVEESPASKSSVEGVVVQENLASSPFPISELARKLVSQSLNTQSKKILGTYTFGVMGAMAIGTYESGVSGDIKISPDGIVGRNAAGVTTFAIDGTTGDATFKGTLQAGVVVASGALVVGTNVGLGTAEDSAGVTTIVGNVVTTGYVNALNVTAKHVVASISISSPSISGGTIIGTTIKTKASGVRVELAASEATIKLFDSGDDQVFIIDEATYGADAVVRIASSDARGIWIDSDEDLWLMADGAVSLSNATVIGNVGIGGTLTVVGNSFVGGYIDMNNHDIKEVNQIIFNDSSQYIDGSEGDDMRFYFVDNCEFFKSGVAKAIIDDNIWTAGTYYQSCSAFVGDPFKVLDTIKPKHTIGGKTPVTALVELDHSKIHPVLKADFTTKDGKKHNSMSLSGLVKVQNTAILKLLERVEILEKSPAL